MDWRRPARRRPQLGPGPLPAQELHPAQAEIVSARLYVTALGLHESQHQRQARERRCLCARLDGLRQARPVQRLRRDGPAAARRKHAGRQSWATAGRPATSAGRHRQQYVDRPRLLAQLEVKTAAGATITVASDRTWKHWYGPLLHNDLLMGEAYDARLELRGWDRTRLRRPALAARRAVRRHRRRPGRHQRPHRPPHRGRWRPSPTPR